MPDRPAQQPIVVFHHVPKTAGTTLRLIFKQFYKPEETLEVDENVASIEPYVRDKAALRRLRLVLGHSAFRFLDYYDGPVRLVTFVRDPFARLISHYLYVRFLTTHFHHKEALELPAEEYFKLGSLDDHQARMLALEGLSRVKYFPPLAARGRLYDEAMRNLREQFLFVGLAERFDESIVLLKRRLGWPRLPIYAPLNISEKKEPTDDLVARKAEIERGYLSIDKLVYQSCARRFEQEWNLDREENERQLAELKEMRCSIDELLRVRDGMLGYFKYLKAGTVRRAAYAVLQAGDRVANLRKTGKKKPRS